MVIRHDNTVIDRENMRIIVGDRVLQFDKYKRGPPTYSRFENLFFEGTVHLMLNGWSTRQGLFDFFYADSPEGGPNQGVKIIDVHFARWRPKLEELGLNIIKDKRGGTVWYKIVSRQRAMADA